MKYSANKEINAWVRQQVQQGWMFFWGGKHGRLRAPSGCHIVTIPSTPGDRRRALLNLQRDARKALAWNA